MNLDRLTMEQLQGNQRELAETIGLEAYKKLVARYRGSNIYVGKADEALRASRDEEIYSRFNGENYLALAHEYGLAEKTIHDIIRMQREIENSHQMTLFLPDEEIV